MKEEPIIKEARDKHQLGLFYFCKTVSEDFGKLCGVEMETMVSKNRKREAVAARQLSMYALNNLGINGKYICWFFNRERTSIYYSLRSAKNILDTEEKILEHTNNIIKKHEQRRV
jgi:chromosomal replication initiation ATPase DnaA|tara:strand:+ start:501 stop:845 length:345 start_codon:yes stop_codon:yes gene_type:complete